MTEPLVDRVALAAWLMNRVDPRGIDWDEVAADEVIAYLRSVLTPDVLCVNDLHRRIFGEDQCHQ